MTYTIIIDTTNLKSIKAAERKKAQYENKGYILVHESATPCRARLIYKTA